MTKQEQILKTYNAFTYCHNQLDKCDKKAKHYSLIIRLLQNKINELQKEK